jgi:hypothetical protein
MNLKNQLKQLLKKMGEDTILVKKEIFSRNGYRMLSDWDWRLVFEQKN